MMASSYLCPSSVRFYALCLLSRQRAFPQLHTFAQQQQLHAAWIAGCTDSLADVALYYAGQEDITLLNGTFEVISLNGVLEQSGKHLHLCVSDPRGTMPGSHIMSGRTVQTTLELVVGSLEELAFSRQPCALPGYNELYIPPIK